ncbi:TerB family tellurite resistance protein [Thermithiobacillus plumbiphilus]|uniref:TerB family tellurite resistance protein n=1 Tax=Thermithiobacillus plumbiphilus TaxID=1729899 RepID=A0ABU9D4B9_9PROT
MLNALREFFDKHFPSADQQAAGSVRDVRLAAAVLLQELACADTCVGSEEQQKMLEILRSRFALSDSEASELLDLAKQLSSDHAGYHEFTTQLNAQLHYDEKVHLIEQMWQVAFADGRIDKYEDHLIRKIAGLLYVSHPDFIAAKLRAEAAA